MSAIRTNLVVGALRLGTLIDGHARDAGRQLGEWLSPWLRDGEVLPDFALVLELPARMLRQAAEKLRERQGELADARSRDAEARFRRNQTASALRRKLVEVRRLLIAVHGPRHTATLLGFAGGTAHDTQPALLLSHAAAFSKLLRDPRQVTMPRADFSFDSAVVADTVEALAAACGEACGQLDEIRRASTDRLQARDRAWGELAHAAGCVVQILGGWLRLIHRTDLAEKLAARF